MNKTQKGAWLNVVGTLLVLVLALYLTIEIGIRHKFPERIWVFIWAPAFILVTVIGIVLIRRKQSPAEPEADERDKLIQYRAVLAAFVSVWLVLAAESVIPKFIVGPDGSLPVWLLPIINVGLFYIVLLVYSVAVLIQYGRRVKGETS
jgi:amino acid transporter